MCDDPEVAEDSCEDHETRPRRTLKEKLTKRRAYLAEELASIDLVLNRLQSQPELEAFAESVARL
jgi:hypothetical protein